MYNINKHTIKDIIKQELLMLKEDFQKYWGSEQQIKNEIAILSFTKEGINEEINEDIVEWYKRLLKKY